MFLIDPCLANPFYILFLLIHPCPLDYENNLKLNLCESDNATFITPFTRLGQSAEACSSYLFPKIMGPSKAAEMILFNKKITAVEAKQNGLVAEVFPTHEFASRALERALGWDRFF